MIAAPPNEPPDVARDASNVIMLAAPRPRPDRPAPLSDAELVRLRQVLADLDHLVEASGKRNLREVINFVVVAHTTTRAVHAACPVSRQAIRDIEIQQRRGE